jgi:phenylalanine-4-hydroxylase
MALNHTHQPQEYWWAVIRELIDEIDRLFPLVDQVKELESIIEVLRKNTGYQIW